MNLKIISLYNPNPTIDLIIKIMKIENAKQLISSYQIRAVKFIKESLSLTIDVVKIGSNLSNKM